MPDGGRDAIHYDQGFSYKGAIVYQVKFAREPAKLDDPAGWICKAIDGEREKAERLASRGVARYVLMTNIEGSSHLDAGQMDRVKSHLAGSPTFPAEQFAHLSLAPLDDDLALTYARKWARARRLNEKDSQQLPLTLREKMQGAHIAQLAKNTMQLSILLSLVQRRGASLPDKRTELYNAYFDIFLDREAEKSPVVRDNRDLLFDIHRFLGFHLHANAELHKTSGRIRHEDLKWLLRDYLTRERQPHDLVDDLLTVWWSGSVP